MEQERSKRDRPRERKRKQKDTASEESKAKEKESDRLEEAMYTGRVYSCIILSSLPETLQTTALPSSPLLTRISTCIFPDILLREAYSAHAYS